MSIFKTKSIWIYHFSAASCNGCGSEVFNLPLHGKDFEKLGIKFVDSIRHADCLLLTGVINTKVLPILQLIYRSAPRPFYTILAGACAVGEGVMVNSYNTAGPPEKFLSVDVYIPGCPPHPEDIILGITRLAEKIKDKGKKKNNDTSRKY